MSVRSNVIHLHRLHEQRFAFIWELPFWLMLGWVVAPDQQSMWWFGMFSIERKRMRVVRRGR